MDNPTVLVVDDEQLIRWSLTERLSQEGYRLLEAGTAADALARHREGVDLVLLDYRLPDGDGLAVLKQMKEADPDTIVILLTAHASVGHAVEAMKHGAYHYANKPFDLDEIVLLVERALETTRLRREVKALRATQAQPYGVARIVGESDAMVAIRALLQKVAASPASTVLLTGESGTGKDLAAKVIHYASDRAAKPFMNITCSALTESLLESELFGHAAGRFTGAVDEPDGTFEAAHGGTIFPRRDRRNGPASRSKLLRVLEEDEFERVGAPHLQVDVRIVAATNRDLVDEIDEGPLPRGPVLPAQRRADLSASAARAAGRHPDARGPVPHVDATTGGCRRTNGVTTEALPRLRYGWPGNIRELRNAVERAMLLVEGERTDTGRVPSGVRCTLAAHRRRSPAQRGHRPRTTGTVPRCPGAGTERLEPDARRRAARDQPLLDRYRIEKFKLERLATWYRRHASLARGRRRRVTRMRGLAPLSRQTASARGSRRLPTVEGAARHEHPPAVDHRFGRRRHHRHRREGPDRSVQPRRRAVVRLSRREVIGRNVSMLMPSPYHEEHDGYLAAYLATGHAKIIGIGREVTGRRRDGTTFPLHLSVGEMSIGGERKFTGMLHDLSERVQLEERLRASEARWRSIIESAVDGIVVIDAHGRIEAFNPAAERLFGYAEREVVGQNVNMLMPSPYHEEHDGYLARYLATGVQKIIGIGREVTGRRQDGTTFPAAPVGRRDVGRRRTQVHRHPSRPERARARSRSSLREQTALARLGEMAAVIAHEVKNPLAGVRGAIQVIGGRLPEDSKDAAIVKEIVTRIDALNELMKDLLLFARPPQPRPAPVELAALVPTTADLLSGDPALKDMQVEVEGSAPPILADADLLKIVFENLLVNGAQAMHGRGTHSRVAGVDRRHLSDCVHRQRSGHSRRDVREKIFTPFFTTKARGSGLGLPTAKRLVEAHHGSISIDCPPGGGTTVTVHLPAQPPRAW